MQIDKSAQFTRLTDGTLLLRQEDGSYRPVRSETDRSRLSTFTDEAIEAMSGTDPDHPGLDETFWASVDLQHTQKQAISIKLDGDILAYFRGQGRGYQTRINAVLRHYVDAKSHEKS